MNSHTRWLLIKQGLTNVHDKEWLRSTHHMDIKDINDNEAILVRRNSQ